jgi:predicted transcriptional regulator
LVPGEPLKPYRPERIVSTDGTDAARIIALLRQAGPSSPRTIAAAINQTRISTYRRLTALVAAGQVTATGKTRNVKYAAISA